MFFDKISENQFFSNIEENLNKLQKSGEARQLSYRENIVVYLKDAEEKLSKAGFVNEALVIKKICENVDLATEGLNDPQKMLDNLEEYGIPLNTPKENDEVIIDLDIELE